MLVSVSGTRGGQDWPQRGETLTVPSSEAADLVAGGLAVIVPDEIETASAGSTEGAVMRRGPGRPRKNP
jgi:hypothetical protein